MNQIRTFLLLALAFSILTAGHVTGQPSAPVTLVKAGRLLDPRTGNVLSPASVLIENGKIKEVGPLAQIQPPAGAKTIDLGSATLLPGLIDSHTHLFLDIIVPPELEQQRHFNGLFAPGILLAVIESPRKRVLVGAQSAREDLESGFTTVRNLGHSGIDGDTELRDGINAGRVPGPRILASGRKLITRGSYVQNLNPGLSDAILQQEFLLIDGADQARPDSGGTPQSLAACEFHPGEKSWEGSCGSLFGENRKLTIAPAKAVTTGVWRKSGNPTTVWAGDMTESGSPNWPLELEIYDKGSGVLRSEYGWFPISGFTARARVVSFQIDTSHPVPPNDLDREIVQRAAAILSTEAAWNRSDTRKCAPTDTKWSIYCAVQRASTEVTGGFHHRRPALELVRQIVDERSEGRNYHHRLMDYNNDPSTRLEDVQSLFAEALARMKKT